MAGFLGFGNYDKPGKGVDKDEPQKHAFFLFFELYFRKFWKLIEANLLFFVFCLPFLALSFVLLVGLGKSPALSYLAFLPLIGIAAIVPGFTFLLRNFVREDPVFLWSDFIDTIRKNWKQALVVGTVDYVACFVLSVAVRFYSQQVKTSSLSMIPLILCLMVSMLLIFMQYYLFPMLITFTLTSRQLFKNALLFSVAGLLRNLFLTVLIGLLVLANYIVWPLLFLIPFLGLGTVGFLILFTVWPKIERFMIPKPEEEEPEQGEDGSIFEDKGRQ